MGKIVILAKGKDADKINDALADSGLDFDVVEPTPSNLLHIVIGMVDDEEPKEEPTEEPKGSEEVAPTDVEPAPEDAEEVPSEEDIAQEDLNVLINGLTVRAVQSNLQESVLYVPSLTRNGAKISFGLDGTELSFWELNEGAQNTQTSVSVNGQRRVATVVVKEAKHLVGPVLALGKVS
jgi:hypothetical protein